MKCSSGAQVSEKHNCASKLSSFHRYDVNVDDEEWYPQLPRYLTVGNVVDKTSADGNILATLNNFNIRLLPLTHIDIIGE